MDDFNSETDSDYTSYWRDWVGLTLCAVLYLSWNHFQIPPARRSASVLDTVHGSGSGDHSMKNPVNFYHSTLLQPRMYYNSGLENPKTYDINRNGLKQESGWSSGLACMVRRWLAPRYAFERILIINVYPNYTAIHALWEAPKPSSDVYTQSSLGYLRWGLHWFTFTLVHALHEFEPPGGVLDHSEAPPSRCLS